jgi:RHS repeat-associated protein
LGQLTSKKVGSPLTPQGGIGTWLQNINYSYNIRGWLTGINDINNLTDATTPPSGAGGLVIVEESNYYPFGLKQTGYNNVTNSLGNSSAQKYKYNGKELQGELGLNMYDYGARNYDATIGRWMNIDPLAEMSRRWSPYNYAVDNPVYFIDPDGMEAESGPQRWANSSETRPDDWIQWKSSDGENHITYDSSITTKEQAEKKGYTNVTKVFANGIAHNSDYTDVAEFSADGHYVINGGEKLDVDDTSSTMTTGNTFISENKGIVDAIGDFLPGALQVSGNALTAGAFPVAATGVGAPAAALMAEIGGVMSGIGTVGELINDGFEKSFSFGKAATKIIIGTISTKLGGSSTFSLTEKIANDNLFNLFDYAIDEAKK